MGSEFQEELLPQDIPLRTIYTLYDEYEEIRQKKLRLCREERNRLLEDELKLNSNSALEKKLKSLPSEQRLSKSNKQSSLSRTKTVGLKSGVSRGLNGDGDKESNNLHRELVSKKEKKTFSRPPSARSRPVVQERKPQRCTSSVTKGSRVRVRSSSAPNTKMKLPIRDQKIIKLMEDRREKEKKEMISKTEAHHVWE